MNKRLTMLGLAGLFAIGVAACGGGGGDSGSPTSPTSLTGAEGSASKGPFVKNSTVELRKIDPARADGLSATDFVTTAITDDQGSYVAAGANWTGPTMLTVKGKYFDEATGAPSRIEGTSRAVIKLASGVKGKAFTNPLSDMVAQNTVDMVKAAAAAGTPMTADAIDVAVTASKKSVSAFFKLPADTDPNLVDLSANGATGSAAAVQLRAAVVAVSAAIVSIANSAGLDSTGLSNFFATILKDMNDGVALGTKFKASGAKNADGVAKGVGSDLSAKVKDYATGTAVPKQLSSTGTVTDYKVKDAMDPSVLLKLTQLDVIKGVGCANNQFGVLSASSAGLAGSATYMVSSNGDASVITGGSVYGNNVRFTCNLVDFNNDNGTVSANGSYVAGLAMNLVDTSGKRKINVNIDKVKVNITASSPIATTTPGTVTATVPAGAVFSFSGTDATGTTISFTSVANGAEDSGIVSAVGGVLTVNASALLSKVSAKLGPTTTQLASLSTSGMFTFDLGFSGLDIGQINIVTGKLLNLYPIITNKVPGRRVFGSMVVTP